MKSKLLAGIVILAAVVGGGVAYAWNRATALPKWYGATGSAVPDASVSVSDLVASNATDRDSDGQLEVIFDEAELNQAVVSAIANQPQAAPLLDHAKGFNTSIERDRIETGMVMNLSEIPIESLPQPGQQAVMQLAETFPMLASRDIYVGLEGSPQIVDGQLRFDETALLKVGQFSIPLQEVASRFGLSQTELEQQLTAALAQQGISLEELQIENGQLIFDSAAQ
ncbi:MAG: hypothetical protein F6J97_15580 [Leptolyngbya sp. SIO4C1]|nr:hypothetical protein [Leptolyngbya sp. SIO4C1]